MREGHRHERGTAVGTARSSRRLVADLREVAFMGSSGITALIEIHSRCRHQGLALWVVADQYPVGRPLQLAGLDRTLGLVADPEEAGPG